MSEINNSSAASSSNSINKGFVFYQDEIDPNNLKNIQGKIKNKQSYKIGFLE